jgi:hypothetical protein
MSASELGTVIVALHDSEINGEVSWFFDRLWSVKLGDPFTGYDAVATVASIEEAVEWLRANAVRLYPDSTFAQLYSGFGPTGRRAGLLGGMGVDVLSPLSTASDLAGLIDPLELLGKKCCLAFARFEARPGEGHENRRGDLLHRPFDGAD